MEHLFYTWCRPGYNLSGSAGWGIRAISSGLLEHEGQQLVPVANYQFLDSVDPTEAPIRLAYIKHSSLGNIVIHGTPIGLCPGNTRSGNYFTHCLSKLEDNFDGFKAICLWDSDDWVREDFDLDPSYEEKNAGISRIIAEPPSEIFVDVQNRLQTDPAFYENALHCLESFLALDENKKLHIVGSSSDIAELIKVIGACLPPTERKALTFSTYDNPDTPPEVKILGCFFADPNREDLPEYHYQEGFFTLNTYTDRKSTDPPQNEFARNILNVLRDYGESNIEILHNFIEKYSLREAEDLRALFQLYPLEGQRVDVDGGTIGRILSWPTEFLNDLPEKNLEELVAWIRANVSPKSNLGQTTPPSRDWIINNLSLLKEIALGSNQTRGLLTELFEENEIQVSMEYLNAFEGYLDSSIAENARSRALYEIGRYVYLKQPPAGDPDTMERLVFYCQILAQELNALPWDDPNRLNSLLWQGLIKTSESQKDFESLFEEFKFLIPGGEIQGFLEQVADCLCNFCPDQLPAKLEPLLNLAERNALAIPEQTLGAIFCTEDDWFYYVFDKLNNSPTYLARIFHNDKNNSNAVCFFERYAGEKFELRFTNVVYQGQLNRTNFDQLRDIAHQTDPEIRKRVDNYILYDYPSANPAYQSLYNQKLESLGVDDLLDKRNYNFSLKLQGTCATEQTHPIMAELGVHGLAQEDNWNFVRDEISRKDFFRRYQRLSERKDAQNFCELYANYIYEGLNEFTALESYLEFDSASDKADDESLLTTKLNLLNALITKINLVKNQQDTHRKSAFTTVWFYFACLLPNGITGKEGEGQLKAAPLIDFKWIYWGKRFLFPPKTPKTIITFVGNVLKPFIKSNERLVSEELKKKMLEAFKKRPIAENEICFGAGKPPSPESSWYSHKLLLPLIALGLATVIIIFINKSCSSGSGDEKIQPANTKDGKNK